jgi:glyoxylase-like metal-dependent hydrolase (beta-lactamase superfamily II)
MGPPAEPMLPHPFARPPLAPPVASLTPAELARERGNEGRLYLLDVRPASERRLARLADDGHIPLAELRRRASEIPSDRPVVVYDQFGPDARRAADLLNAVTASSVRFLTGGIESFARDVDPAVGRYDAHDPALLLRQLPRPSTGCLSYFLGDPVERVALIVDPGEASEPYLHALRSEEWTLAAIVETHTHADHLAGHAALAHATDAPIYVSRRSPAQYPHRSLGHGDSLDFGTHELLALETPGHTRDHLTLRLGERIFTGDTLLIGGCGRTDLGDGDPNLLYDSLHDTILPLPDATEIFPAHYGPHHALGEKFSSLLGVERATNEALRQDSRAAFLSYMTEGWPPKPENFDRIVAANLANFPG